MIEYSKHLSSSFMMLMIARLPLIELGVGMYDFPRIRCWTPSQNTLILLNKNPKIYESVLDKEVNIGQKAYDFPMVSQAAFEN